MSEDTTVSKFKFQVTVDTSVIPPIFTFYNEQHQATNGSVNVKEMKSKIIYNLATPGFFFVAPAITNNFYADVCASIAEEGQQLIISDKAERKEDIGLQLIIENVSTGQRYASPDPRIKNVVY